MTSNHIVNYRQNDKRNRRLLKTSAYSQHDVPSSIYKNFGNTYTAVSQMALFCSPSFCYSVDKTL